ncbi:MAG: tetratricopeptide repeat protein [Spirochaetales bacterium]|nr:tetratricopeptide repeat protein [Spirochaetales bacterium]
MAVKRFLAVILGITIASLLFAAPDDMETEDTEEIEAVESAPPETTYYRVTTDVDEEYTRKIANKMEAALKFYNQIFHFDLNKLTTKLKVTIYKDKNSFDAYLKRIINQTREDFVYIHYSDLVKCELVGYKKKDEADFNASLLHQGMIQFVKAFVPATPLWITEGMAAYLETSAYDEETNTFTLVKNMNWLDTLKNIMKEDGEKTIIPIADLLTIEKETALSSLDIFYPEAWGFVYFLLNVNNKNYNRIIWDALNRIDPKLTLDENSRYLKDMISEWVDITELETNFRKYILSIKTYYDLVLEGIAYYTNKEFPEAEQEFLKALDLKPNDYFAYYYIGLIKYSESKYLEAEEYYSQALEKGAEKGLTYYAMGINAYADNRYENAVEYLKQAKKEDAENYMDKADEILARIETEDYGE